MGLHKKSEKCEASTKYEKCIPKTKRAKKREGRKRGGEQGQQRERREQKNKAGPYTILRCTASKFFIASHQNEEKSMQC